MKIEPQLFWRILCAVSLLASTITSAAGNYEVALPGYRYSFPRDYFSHPNYQTEWWYYTGNLQTSDGHRFGFELTFFAKASRASSSAAIPPKKNPRGMSAICISRTWR